MRHFHFTLLETVAAVAILAMSLAVLFQLSASAGKRITRASEDWHHTHMLAEAAEYVLLHGNAVDSIPSKFFSYDGYTVYIQWDEMEDIHEEYTMGSVAGQPELQACTLSLVRTSDGKELDRLVIDRILYDDALTEQEN